jgi:hypothetical protein
LVQQLIEVEQVVARFVADGQGFVQVRRARRPPCLALRSRRAFSK